MDKNYNSLYFAEEYQKMYEEYEKHTIAAYAGYITNEEELLECTSGGIATALSREMIKRGGYVAGVSYSEDFTKAQYRIASQEAMLQQFKGSKYTEVEKGTVYKDVKVLLDSGKPVLFFGLPCTVAAMKSFLGKSYDNFISVDLICHGPTPAAVHQQYIEYLEEKMEGRIIEFSVRRKKNAWLPAYLYARFDNGKIFEREFRQTEYGYAFDMMILPRCYTCKFRGNNRTGDIMIGDFGGATKEDEFWNNNGISAILVHTEKGRAFLQSTGGIQLYSTTFHRIVEGNPAIITSKPPASQTNKFSELFARRGLIYATQACLAQKNPMDYMKRALETIKKVYQMLEDETSKEIYMNRLAYNITGSSVCMEKLAESYTKEFPWYDGHCKNGFFKLLEILPKDRKIILFGAGGDSISMLPYFRSDSRFIGFCSSFKEQQENGYQGFPVMAPEELLARKDCSVVVSTSIYRNEIMEILSNGEYPRELIFDGPAFYKPDSGKAAQYFGPDFMRFQDEEVFVDAGCFDFASSRSLAKRCSRIKVYAFEQDPSNYQRCLKMIHEMDESRLAGVKLLPCGAWSEEMTLSFQANGTVSSRLCGDGTANSYISALPIDSVIDSGDRVTMIKMDIEGAELEALKGAQKTIRRDKPKLAICIYHKPEDLWEIPLYIKELMPECRLYIRHHSYGLAETVLYAVMPE